MGNFVGAEGESESEEPQVDRRASMAADLNEMLADDPVNASEQALLDQDVTDLQATEKTEEPTPEPPATPEAYQLGDRAIPADQVNDVLGLLDWASSLTEEQAARMMAALNEQPAPSAEPISPPPPEKPAYITELEAIDPTIAKAISELHDQQEAREAELRAELATYRGELNQLETYAGQEIAARTKIETDTAETQVAEAFLTEHNLTVEDYPALVETAGALGITDSLVRQYGLEGGFRKTLEAALYANEDLRQRTVVNQAQSSITQQATASKKEAASGLGPQGGTNLPTQNVANLPQSEKRKAMIRDIETLMGQG